MTKLKHIEQLLRTWEDRVDFLTQSKYEGRFYRWDYLNDIDCRESIEESLSALNKDGRAKLERIDAKLKAITEATDSCIWGPENAQHQHWTPERNWWYFRRPKNLVAGWGWDEVS